MPERGADNEQYQAWLEQAQAELRGPVRPHSSSGGIKYQPVYFPGDVAADATAPGQLPFTRGPRASMYQGRPWTLRQYAGFSTAEESNAFYRANLAKGQRGLSVAFDLPTHRGYDSDHERARADVGKAGVAVDTVEDLRVLFQEIPLDQVSVSMTMNGAVLPIMAGYLVAAEEQGASVAALQGTIQNDILKEFLVRNTYIYPPEPSMRVSCDVIGFCAEHVPKFNPVSVSGYHMKEAGASEELELAFTLADGLAYVERAVAQGLSVDSFAPRLSFFFGIGMDLFLEVAKLRAARRLWAELITTRFAPKNPESARLRTHCQTSGVSLTAQDPMNNVVRTTVEALAAVLGGTQSLHTNAFDEALGLPTDESARIARNTQLILQEETDVTRVVDPLAGSYLVEDLTNRLADRAREILSEVEAEGGMTRAIESGYAGRKINQAAAERQARLDNGRDRIVGVNCFEGAEGDPVDVRVVDHESVLSAQLARLDCVRRERDASGVERTLQVLRAAAETSSENLLSKAIDCVRARATVGEVSATLEEVYGRFEPRAESMSGVYSVALGDDEDFQALRTNVEAFSARVGRRPRILVAKIGQDGHDRGAKVVATGFADAGFDVELSPLFQTPQEVAEAALEGDCHVIGLSSQAGAHRVLVQELLAALRLCGAAHMKLVLGGIIPDQDHAALRDLGVVEIFGPGTRIVDAASRVLLALSDVEA